MAVAGIFVGIVGLVFYLFMLLLPVALLIALQVWLCRKNVKLGMILPALSLALSLLLTGVIGLSMGAFSRGGNTLTVRDGTTGEIVRQESYESEIQIPPRALVAAGVAFLVTNIPTVTFGGIWLHYKGRRDTYEDLKKMRIEDLE